MRILSTIPELVRAFVGGFVGAARALRIGERQCARWRREASGKSLAEHQVAIAEGHLERWRAATSATHLAFREMRTSRTELALQQFQHAVTEWGRACTTFWRHYADRVAPVLGHPTSRVRGLRTNLLEHEAFKERE